MNKRSVIYRVVVLAALVLIGSAAMHLVLVHAGWPVAAWALDIAAVSAVIVTIVGCFHQNLPIFGSVVTGRGVSASVMCLTFDDGPSAESTPLILDALSAANTKATFFLLGKHIQQHPGLVRRIADEGHEIASHGWTHRILVLSRPSVLRHELDSTSAVMDSLGVPRPQYFRTPHGFRSPFLVRVARSLGYSVVGWTKGVFDTALPGPGAISERSRAAMRPGAILLLHDGDGNGTASRLQTAQALPSILDGMKSLGLQGITVSELDAMTPPRRAWRLRTILGPVLLLIVAGLILMSVRHSRDAFVTLATVNLWFLALAIGANLVSIGLKAAVWHATLVVAAPGQKFRYRHVTAALFVGFLLNTVLVARAGEPARAFFLQRKTERTFGDRIPLATIFGTIVTETLVLGITLVFCVTVLAAAVPGMPSGTAAGVLAMLVIVVAAAVVIGLANALANRMRPQNNAGGAARAWIDRPVRRILRELHQGHRLMSEPRQLAMAVAAGTTSWLANLAAIWLVLQAFGIRENAVAAAVVVFVASNLVGAVQLTPGNVGVFQVAVAFALAQATVVDTPTAIGFAIGLQAVEAGMVVIPGLLFLLFEGVSLSAISSGPVEVKGSPS